MALKEDFEPKRLGYYLIILVIAFIFVKGFGTSLAQQRGEA